LPKTDFGVGHYVKFATSKISSMRKHDAEVCFVHVLDFIDFTGIWFDFLIGF